MIAGPIDATDGIGREHLRTVGTWQCDVVQRLFGPGRVHNARHSERYAQMAMNRSVETINAEEQHTVVGIFENTDNAIAALNELREADFNAEQISVVARDAEATTEISEQTDLVAEEAGKGALAGTFLGGVAGWLIGISALAIPGIGPVIGAGIIGTALAGAGIGAAAGGLIGALGAYGIPEEDARGYEEEVRQGGVLLTAHAGNAEQAAQAQMIFDRIGSHRARTYAVAADGSAQRDAIARSETVPRT